MAEEFQGLGIGRAVLEELLRLAEAHGFHAVLARIAGNNDASVALHAACGFELIGTEQEVGRKFGRWLDVVCMEAHLAPLDAVALLSGGSQRGQLFMGSGRRQAFAVEGVHPGKPQAGRQPDPVGIEEVVDGEMLAGHLPTRSLSAASKRRVTLMLSRIPTEAGGLTRRLLPKQATTADEAASQTMPSVPTKMASSAPRDSAQRYAAMLTA